MSFSWPQMIKDVERKKLERAHNLARGGVSSDFDIAHPDWVADAQQNKFASLDKAVKLKLAKHYAQALARRQKHEGKQ